MAQSKSERNLENPATELAGVVVLAFGPRATTRGLAKAHRKTATDLNVPLAEIAALGQSGRALTDTSEPITEALDSFGDGPILFVHDDVAIDVVSLARLVRAHLDGATVAVPSTNDRGSGHFHGSLPPASTARAELRRLAKSSAVVVTPITQARPSCLVTDTETLRNLLTKRIHDPFAVLKDRGVGLYRVDGAFAAHDGACGAQVRAAGRDLDRPLLVASMIVKDEQDMLPGCLESLKGLVDRVEIVDTGSVDETITIAKEWGANVTEIDWRDDFSWARNQAAELCRDAVFTLWIDADERVAKTDTNLVRDVLGAYRDEFDALDINLANRNNGIDAEPTSVFRARRLVRSHLLAFSGRIHETPVRFEAPGDPLNTTLFDLMSIDHLGYADDVVESRGKSQRNLKLARKQHLDDRSVKASVDLARSLMLADDSSAEAISLLRQAVVAAEDTRPEWLAYLLGSLGGILMNAGETEEAAELSARGYAILPTDALVAAVFSSTMVSLGRSAELLAAVDSPPATDLPDPVYNSPEHHRLAEQSITVARAQCGQPSWATVLDWADDGRSFDESVWNAVAEIGCRQFDDVDLLEALLPLMIAKGDVTGLLPAVAKLTEPHLTALLAVSAIEAAAASVNKVAVSADVVSTGLVAAMVSCQWPLFDELAPSAHVLGADVRNHLARHLSKNGQTQRAAVIEQPERQRGLVASFGGSSA